MGLSNLPACLIFSFSNLLVLSRCSNHALPCGLCPATYRGIISWLDNRKCAGWLAAGITCAHWACNCTVFEIPGVDGTNIAPDYMHNMFLGWLQYLYGSIMYMLVFVVMSGSHEDNLKQIAAFIKNIRMTKAPSTNTDRGLISFQCQIKRKTSPDSEAGPLTSWDCMIQCWLCGRSI